MLSSNFNEKFIKFLKKISNFLEIYCKLPDIKVSSGTLHLVMKVRRKKKDPKIMSTKIIGMVNTIYTFDMMCDFQYLPIKKRIHTTNFDDMMSNLIPTDMASALSWWTRKDIAPTSLFLPPYQFSRYLTPSTKILARETDFSMEKTKRVNKLGHGQNLRIERKALSLTVQAGDEFPKAPSEEAIEDADFRCKNEEPHRLISELFKERPMWTRVAISYRTGLDESMLKGLLQKYAFYIQSGPWGRLWCKFGYDPREHRESGQFQTLMVSFRQNGRIPEKQRLKVSADRSQAQTIPNILTEVEEGPVKYVYEAGKLPKVRQMWYCIVDVHMEEARQLYNSSSNYEPTSVALSGWVSPDVVNKIRDIVKNDVNRTSNELETILNHSIPDEDF
ncbi:unnamed protein product [Caenorhabditis angaria]|uniref:Transcription factor IIIC subunit 5 HTH domain-containing protein n=1 Tax=Caenorhabditis angaria TaxID=860376 RepID=A0A9P1N1I6_9PELO|nr:unnamed protein product [Caenorhabditis angaria]